MAAPAGVEQTHRIRTLDDAKPASGYDLACSEPWQRGPYEDWVARLGTDRMDGVLHALRDQLRELLRSASDSDRAAFRRLAHDAAATAGMLGFLDVTRCCRALLEASSEDDDTAARLRLGGALEAAIGVIGRHLGARVAEAA